MKSFVYISRSSFMNREGSKSSMEPMVERREIRHLHPFYYYFNHFNIFRLFSTLRAN